MDGWFKFRHFGSYVVEDGKFVVIMILSPCAMVDHAGPILVVSHSHPELICLL